LLGDTELKRLVPGRL